MATIWSGDIPMRIRRIEVYAWRDPIAVPVSVGCLGCAVGLPFIVRILDLHETKDRFAAFVLCFMILLGSVVSVFMFIGPFYRLVRLVLRCLRFVVCQFGLLPPCWSFRISSHAVGDSSCRDGCRRPPTQLCSLCRDTVAASALLSGGTPSRRIWWPVVASREKHPHHTLSCLAYEAQDCHLCHLLWTTLRDHDRPNVPEMHHACVCRSQDPAQAAQRRLTLAVREMRSLHYGTGLKMQLTGPGLLGRELPQQLWVEWKKLYHGCDSDPDTDSAMTMQMASHWIRTCQKHHEVCMKSLLLRGPLFKPTRLIAVGQPGDDTVRLVEPSQPLDYAALTHRWGESAVIALGARASGPAQLRTSNLAEWKAGITVNTLPRTFQEAIAITQALGLGFLWIDSCCIIQDSLGGGDWMHESQTMGRIYAHAVVVLSATAATNGESGMFRPKRRVDTPTSATAVLARRQRDRRYLVAWREKDVSVPPHNTGTPDRVARAPNATLAVAATGDPENERMDGLYQLLVEHAPVSSRGWTFQERMLATRILHFGDGLVLFECGTLRASEVQASGVAYPPKSRLAIDGHLRHDSELADLLRPDDQVEMGSMQVPNDRYAVRFGVGGGTHSITVPVAVVRYRSPAEKRLRFLHTTAMAGQRGDFQLLLAAQHDTIMKRAQFHLAWYALVQRYATRGLTRESDRLMALAGVASSVHRVTHVSWVAGLWADTLAMDLLWYVADDAAVHPSRIASPAITTSTAVCDAPSWSWARIGGRVVSSLLEKVLGADSERQPSIRLLADVSVAKHANANTKEVADTKEVPNYGDTSNGLLFTAMLSVTVRYSVQQPTKATCVWDPAEDDSALVRRTATYMPLVQVNSDHVYGLLIAPGRDAADRDAVGEPPHYRRVGCFFAQGDVAARNTAGGLRSGEEPQALVSERRENWTCLLE